MYRSNRPQYSSILYVNESLFRKQLWDRSLSLALSNRRLYFPVTDVYQVTHLRHLGRVNFQSMVLILLHSVMYKHRVTFTFAYFFRLLVKEL